MTGQPSRDSVASIHDLYAVARNCYDTLIEYSTKHIERSETQNIDEGLRRRLLAAFQV